MTESIIIHRPAAADTVTYDEHGDLIPGTPTAVTSPGWAVGPSAEKEEQVAFGSYPVTGLRLYNRAAVDIRVGDEITLRDERWKVVGEAAEWVSPFSTFEGTAVSVGRVA